MCKWTATAWVALAVCVVPDGPGTASGDRRPAARQDDSGPRYRAVVTCFNNVNDESGSLCSGTCYQADGALFKTGKMKCGFAGKVSEIEWTFLGRQGSKDRYRFTRRFPADVAGTTTTQKEVEFARERVIIFEDKSQRIVMESPRK